MQVSVYVKQLIQYLSIMHNNGIYHSDIKPSNIMISKPTPVASQSIMNSGYFNNLNVTSMVG
jgi:serine/threonine protein kinase